jgi:hypothetical protein
MHAIRLTLVHSMLPSMMRARGAVQKIEGGRDET